MQQLFCEISCTDRKNISSSCLFKNKHVWRISIHRVSHFLFTDFYVFIYYQIDLKRYQLCYSLNRTSRCIRHLFYTTSLLRMKINMENSFLNFAFIFALSKIKVHNGSNHILWCKNLKLVWWYCNKYSMVEKCDSLYKYK